MSKDQTDPIVVLQSLLNSIIASSESKEELIRIWFYIGRMMGISEIFPEMQVVVTPNKQGENQPVLLIGTVLPLVVDLLTSEGVLTEDLANLCLEEIKALEESKVYH
jgi:hypothetical protein